MSGGQTTIEGQSPIRLSGRTTSVGSATGLPVWGMGLFGLPFIGFGVWAVLMGTGLVAVDNSDLNAPTWVLSVFGLVFVGAGLMVWGMAGRQALREKQRRQHALLHPNEPAMQDYPWDPSGYTPARWMPVAKTIGMAIFMTVFLSIFNWWAFFSGDDSVFLKVIVSIFDLVLIFVWFAAFKSLAHALKFGRTRLEFGQFPYRPGDWFQAKILLPAGLERVESAKLILRCVLEYYEVRQRGNKRSKQLVHEQLWCEEQQLGGAEIGQWPRFLNATFTLPTTAPGTRLADERPIFWELELEMQVPGVDLKQQYLVPVYARGPEPAA